ncbi:hypothetical protein SAMN04488067_102101 [Halorubrum xinjiangense]|uniref:Small CPxCG-related zinc finger protein n=1 Tax=Halorubrum xinjiangense TaxID=261291 RepID=A0A1G7IM66_9EURY|nr:hypothetical protein [Halorubrum xinjiangense]SDF13781.1 hypothetical protein SAMN04488067_102101 [Halorubrum xinjiangense]
MAHSPERVEEFVCEDCQVTHAGTPVQGSSGGHEFEPPVSCGACGGTEFVSTEEWIHHRK